MRILMHTSRYVDSLACTVADGLIDLGHEVYNTKGQLNYGEPAQQGMYDLYIMADTDDHKALEGLSDTSSSPRPRLVIHAHDRWIDYLNAPNSPIKPVPDCVCDIMFVRDLDISVGGKRDYPTYPIDYGAERRYQNACQPYVNNDSRKQAMVFYGTLSTAKRLTYLEAVKRAGIAVDYGAYNFNTPDGHWSKWVYGRYTHDPNYYKELCKYMYGFAPFGAGSSCFRHAELYSAGCIPVIQHYPDDIISLHNFVDGENCILWKTGEELIIKLLFYNEHLTKAEDLRRRCYEFGQKYMLTKYIAQFMLDKMKEHKLI
jgi:hypothetical protein